MKQRRHIPANHVKRRTYLVGDHFRICSLQRPLLMMDIPSQYVPRFCFRKKTISLGEPINQITTGGLNSGSPVIFTLETCLRLSGVYPATAVVQPVILLPEAHPRTEIRKVEERARCPHGHPLISVQGEKINPEPTPITDVRS